MLAITPPSAASAARNLTSGTRPGYKSRTSFSDGSPPTRSAAATAAAPLIVVSGETIGYAVRRHWPDGSHDYVELSPSLRAAQLAARRDEVGLRTAPFRPVDYRVVAIARAEFDRHRRRHGCRAPECP